ncbi:MAG: hypothetical protein ABW061_15965 [Polyangiaceae bacterium]
MPRRYSIALGIALSAGAALSCSAREHPRSFVDSAGSGQALEDGGGGLMLDLAGAGAGADPALCGNEQIQAITNPPNLYFVIDRSGSMTDPLPGSAYSKYENARIAISVMLRAVGHRVRYGAGVYPALLNQDGCAPGIQVFPTSAGDPPSYAAKGENGPVLSDLLTRLGNLPPSGGTPTAATLREFEPTIEGLEGRTYVILMTDGAPNCNLDLRCGVDGCIPNIEGLSISDTRCDASFNCCSPKVSAGNCVDADDSEAAVAAYEEAGIDTYVVGMPGSEAYGAVLGRLAVAGHTARPGKTPYYAVSDTAELSEALRSIGAQVAISCDLPLSEEPDDPALVNVYFDAQVIPKDDTDGWQFTGKKAIHFEGAACARLSSGDVLTVQVLSGCPTVVR